VSELNVFRSGEKALFIDSKQRRYLVTLDMEGEFHSHSGFVAHRDVIGSPTGRTVESTKGAKSVVLRPTLEDFVIEMPRGAQVIYPKDLAPMCMLGDIHPGVRVWETGVGSGALSMTMLRWGATITGTELREDFLARARQQRARISGRGRTRSLRRECRRQLSQRAGWVYVWKF